MAIKPLFGVFKRGDVRQQRTFQLLILSFDSMNIFLSLFSEY